MCGIIGAVAQRDVVPILMDGLRRLEYRGYDSAGIALVTGGELERVRTPGKIVDLANLLPEDPPLHGTTGIAHTRWATHGPPNETNAHPHLSPDGRVAVVHNGIIENHEHLRAELVAAGYEFRTDTDTEVICHRIHQHLAAGLDLCEAVRRTSEELKGAYAFSAVAADDPERLVATASGCPLIIGVGVGEHFVASDVAALIAVTQQYMVLEEGDVADVSAGEARVLDRAGRPANRPLLQSELTAEMVERSHWRHFMQKEIHEQPRTVAAAVHAGRIADGHVSDDMFGPQAGAAFDEVRAVRIVACGTSYHAGLVARHWFEELAGVPCRVEIASEFRYRAQVAEPGTLLVALSQSGETADTLGALRAAVEAGFGPSLGIVNVPDSSLVRETDLVCMTHAGPEIGVASTKAFTAQLVALLLLAAVLGRRHRMTPEMEARIVAELTALPGWCEEALALDPQIEALAHEFTERHHALFIGRGIHYPVAMEGALKLKEISYIHAEAYPAGELKHGALALVDPAMPVIALAPADALRDKVRSNVEEVRARGGIVYLLGEQLDGLADDVRALRLPPGGDIVSPVRYTLPLQLLAYHVAVLKGTDVDQPRNLAKSVTVE